MWKIILFISVLLVFEKPLFIEIKVELLYPMS